jgi:hypothetical protein
MPDPARDAATALLAAHDALRTTYAQEPPQSAYNHADWLEWHDHAYKPAFNTWAAAMDRFNTVAGLTSRHPANFRPAAAAILNEASEVPPDA